MKTVGIKYLKDHLSQELQEVRQGETLLVTDRNIVIAEIRQPSPAHVQKVNRLEAWLNAQERAGHLRRATNTETASPFVIPLPPPSVPVDLAQLLEETRADRV
ncbi:MAG: antitoxin PHD [Verrucomicrobia bacterium]|nr:antitoxin PHD [Verrucomicrobiota bacterium]